LKDGAFITYDVDSDNGDNKQTTIPDDLPALVFENFPITVNSQL